LEQGTSVFRNANQCSARRREKRSSDDGVGLAREEFIINNAIGIHPMALLEYEKLEDPAMRAEKIELAISVTFPVPTMAGTRLNDSHN
jgi:pyruvate,water dikinase